MNMKEALKQWQPNVTAPEAVLRDVYAKLPCSLPPDYVCFLQEHNGGEGFVGENYLIVWKAEELINFNREYEVNEYAPGILLFGSNGGGEGFGFDTRDVTLPIVRVPFIGMDLRYAIVVANSFTDLFMQLAGDHGQERNN